MDQRTSIMMVEDSDEDFYTANRILMKLRDFDLKRFRTGAEALPVLREAAKPAELPQLIFLDLNLPGALDGRAVLSILKTDPVLRSIPVIILSTSDNPKDIAHCYDHGAGGYMVKPVDLDKFRNEIESVVRYWFDTVALPN